MQKSEVINLLKSGEVNLTFTKVDGSTREMLATLSEDLIPNPQTTSEASRSKKISEGVCAVWDNVAQGWRSFRWTSVTEVNGVATQING